MSPARLARDAVSDWLELAETEAESRGHVFERHPLTSKATFLVDGGTLAGKVRTSRAPDRDHPRLWHEYDAEQFVDRAHPTVVTVLLDLVAPIDEFDPVRDSFVVVADTIRPDLPGGDGNKHYVYIEDRGQYYYKDKGQRVFLPSDAWDAVFQCTD